jgi:hypothetical protein
MGHIKPANCHMADVMAPAICASVSPAALRNGPGCVSVADNPNDITVTHEFGSVEAAQAFANGDELKKAMQGAGVVGAPTIWFTNKV